jgi:DNA-binding response OmpR family regulator/nitrogen-specific signal transduction histidine kinase
LLLWINQIRVSEKQQIKLERLKSSQEEQLSLQKLQFFTNISHEFRTPLTLIVSPLDDILKHHIKELPTAVREKLKVIYKNTSRMGRLIDELMDFRKLQFDKLRIKPAQHEVGNFVRNIAAHFSEEVVAAQIEFRLNLPEKPLFAYFDANQIEKVIFNLLSNSFKVTNVGGFIELFAFAKVIEEFPFEILCMGVKDSGPGLSPAQVEKIFDRFYQIDGLNKTYYSSTGIGLALAKNLAEMHKGQIKVLSNKGEGASFIVELPMGKAHFTEAELENVPPYSPKTNLHDIETETPNQTNTGTKIKRYTLLVVEDNFQLRKYIKTELQQNYNVMESRDGDEGITRALDKIPDLIISDLLMPEKDGFELCETLKNNPKTAHIPIILLTAKTNVEDQIHGAQIGADLYLTKPFNMSLLKHNVAQLIRNREQLMLKFKEQSILLTDQSAHNAADLDFLQTITRYLLDNITDSELSVESVGDKMNLSRSQLYRKIKTLTGHSANEFIRITRLKQAQKLIKERKLNINEVGYSTGFASPSYFSKCYREYFGNLPSEEI